MLEAQSSFTVSNHVGKTLTAGGGWRLWLPWLSDSDLCDNLEASRSVNVARESKMERFDSLERPGHILVHQG